MSLVTKTLVQEKMDANHLFMLMTDKGYGDKTVQDFFTKAGLQLSNSEFLEIYNGIKTEMDSRKEEVESKQKEEEREPSFQEMVQQQSNGKNTITNNQDLLSLVNDKGNEFVTEDYTDGSSSSSFTTGPHADEPPAEEVTLPSKGKFYKGIIADKKGKLLIRPMTLKEEKIFTTERLLKNGQAIDMVFRNCIKTPGIDTTEILSSDRMFLLFFLRAISYGTIYAVKTKCPGCGTDNENKLDIAKLPINEPPEALTDPFNMTLPSSNLNITMRLSRGRDESEMIKNKGMGLNKESASIADRILSLVIGIDGVNQEDYKK